MPLCFSILKLLPSHPDFVEFNIIASALRGTPRSRHFILLTACVDLLTAAVRQTAFHCYYNGAVT
jgi:hypothetical protein